MNAESIKPLENSIGFVTDKMVAQTHRNPVMDNLK